jgi:hypothetical protein
VSSFALRIILCASLDNCSTSDLDRQRQLQGSSAGISSFLVAARGHRRRLDFRLPAASRRRVYAITDPPLEIIHDCDRTRLLDALQLRIESV